MDREGGIVHSAVAGAARKMIAGYGNPAICGAFPAPAAFHEIDGAPGTGSFSSP
jgi:hypothetical protein